jgi:hypothetical protein
MAWNVYAMRTANQGKGGHWFDAGAMRFFNGRISGEVHSAGKNAGQYFVSSERYDDDTPRLYSVRRFDPETADVMDAPGHHFQEYASLSGAHGAAKRAAAKEAATGWCKRDADAHSGHLRGSDKACPNCGTIALAKTDEWMITGIASDGNRARFVIHDSREFADVAAHAAESAARVWGEGCLITNLTMQEATRG